MFGYNDRTFRRRRFAAALVLAVFAVFLFANLPYFPSSFENVLDDNIEKNESSREQEADDFIDATAIATDLAVHKLDQLFIKNRVSRARYARDKYSPGWGVVNGCDMRNRILARDLIDVALGSDNCTVLSGTLAEDPYTGKTIYFVRGASTSRAVQIEHIVAVSDSWQKGAQNITPEMRYEFYNDPLNLIAVDGPANIKKGDADAASWLPRKEYRCRYVARQIAVKLKYLLWVTKAEYNAMKRVLFTCPGQLLPRHVF